MNTLRQQKKLTHHAYAISGEEADIVPELLLLLESSISFPIAGNPDFWQGSFDVFSVDDGRELGALQASGAVFHDKRVFVLFARSFTDQAQNSLLKMFEEPSAGNHFFIITPNTNLLLPTLRSRLFELAPSAQSGVSPNARKNALDFLAMKKPERLAFTEKVAKEKDKHEAVLFLNALERVLEEKLANASARATTAVSLREIAMGKKYLSQNGASLKIILDHIALAV